MPSSGAALVQLADALTGSDDPDRKILALYLKRPIDQDAYRIALDEEPAEKITALQPLLEQAKRDEELRQVVGDPKAVSFGSQIRSYVLDDRRVKDHRTNVETHDVESVLDRGELDEFIDAELRRKKAAKK